MLIDAFMSNSCIFNPLDQASPVGDSQKIDGDGKSFFGLDKGENFKEFVHCAIAAGKKDKPLGVTHKHNFSNEEVAETDTKFWIDIGVWLRFKRKVNNKTAGVAFSFLRPFVCGFHNTRACACNN